MEQNISRRKLIAGAATVALGSAAFAATGCTAQKQEPEIDFMNSFLPIGSVVTLSSWPEWAPLMIIARRPKATCNTDKKPDENGTDVGIWDYVGVFYPYGFMGDPAKETVITEGYCFQRELITSVLFMGYQNDKEKELSALLNEKIDVHESGFDSTQELAHQFITDLDNWNK